MIRFYIDEASNSTERIHGYSRFTVKISSYLEVVFTLHRACSSRIQTQTTVE